MAFFSLNAWSLPWQRPLYKACLETPLEYRNFHRFSQNRHESQFSRKLLALGTWNYQDVKIRTLSHAKENYMIVGHTRRSWRSFQGHPKVILPSVTKCCAIICRWGLFKFPLIQAGGYHVTECKITRKHCVSGVHPCHIRLTETNRYHGNWKNVNDENVCKNVRNAQNTSFECNRSKKPTIYQKDWFVYEILCITCCLTLLDLVWLSRSFPRSRSRSQGSKRAKNQFFSGWALLDHGCAQTQS